MKLKSILAASLIASASLFSIGAGAADQPADTQAPATTEKPATPQKAEPHSHMEQKTGMPQPAPGAAAPDKPNPATDMSKHYHPRDMK